MANLYDINIMERQMDEVRKQELNRLDRRWINAIIDGRPESEIRQYKTEYIKAMEENDDTRKSIHRHRRD